MSSKTVRLSNDTLDMLKQHAEPFESPDECLKRVLSKSPCEKAQSEDQDESQEDE